MSTAAPSTNGETPKAQPEWGRWRERALAALPLEAVYGDVLTGGKQGDGWLEARDPASSTGDRSPSAGVSDGTNEYERGTLHSFRDSRHISVFDYLVERGRATDFRDAQRIVAELSGVPLPVRPEKPQEAQGGEEKKAAPVVIEVIDSPTFATAAYPLKWHVRQVLIAGQPCIVGGPKKCLKTSLLCDLVISMGAGLDFLDRFRVDTPTRIGFLSGESGPHTIQETARNVCAAKGITLDKANVWWGFDLPQLSQDAHLLGLDQAIRANKLEAIALDPLYLCLLSGNPNAQASNLFDMGPLLAKVASVCLDAGATPILCHHNVKRPPDPYAVPELEDLAFSGIQEFARQWLLVGRREKYELGTGQHKLWLNVGGSAGFSSCWAVNLYEGVLDDDFGGKTWEVDVASATEAITAGRDAREEKRKKAQEAKDKSDDAKVLRAIDKVTSEGEASYTRVRTFAGLNGEKMTRAVDRLLTEGLVEEFEVEIAVGKNRSAKRMARGLRRWPAGEGQAPQA